MTGLPRAIIKKYGVSKKAWSVFRSMKSKPKGERMARRRKARTFGFARRTSRSHGLGPEKMLLPAIAYGAIRQDLSALAAKVPMVGGFGDEVVLGVAGYFMAKKGSGMMRDIGMAALAVEASSVGAQLRSGTLFSGGMLTTTASNGGASF